MRRFLLFVCVASIADAQGTPARWTVSAAPTVTIAGDAPENEFTIINVTRAASGEIAVLEHRSRELRVFSADGRFMKRIAGPGNGPGELPSNTLLRLLRSGDSLYVVLTPGMATSSVSTYTASGGFVTGSPVHAPETPRGGVSPIAPLGSGRWLAMGSAFRVMPPPAAAGEVRPSRYEHGVIHVGDDGSYRRVDSTLVAVWVSYAIPSTAGTYSFVNSATAALEQIGASGDRIWIGSSATGSIRILGADGGSVATVPPIATPRPFDVARLDAVMRRLQESVSDPDRRARIAAQYGRASRPARAPVFTRFLPGVDGEMWVELYREDPSAAAEYRVLDRNGRIVASVTTPAGVRIEDVGRDHVLGVSTDDDGIPSVVLYGLQRR